MKIVYDEPTQKLIDFYENRKAEICADFQSKLNTAQGQTEYNRMKSLYLYSNSYDNTEYHAICNALERIYAFAVPKYLLTKEEYDNLTCPIRKSEISQTYTYPKGFVVVDNYAFYTGG